MSAADLDDLSRTIDVGIREGIAHVSATVDAIAPDGHDLVDALARLLDGGKRMRARLCVHGWAAESAAHPDARPLGRTPLLDDVVAVAVGLEFFQAAALIHDDLIDRSELRRGHPAAHRWFEAKAPTGAVRHARAHFGASSAILAGDLALTESQRMVAAATSASAVGRVALDLFAQMCAEVTVGQYLDLLSEVSPWSADPLGDIERARAVVRAKSARYSVEFPLTIGAALAGADERRLVAWRQVGLPFGEAFQLRDDLLGVYGDPSQTGKPTGDDIREGKRTMLVAFARRDASASDRRLLETRLGHCDLSADDVAAVAAVLTRSGAVARVESEIERLSAAGLDALDLLHLPPHAHCALHSLLMSAVARSA